MKPLDLTKNQLPRKQIVILVIATVAVLLVGWWGWWQFGPKPLGDKLEYIGKFDGGCIWICDSEPYTDYYYATDMTPQEVVDYFKGANLLNYDELTEWQGSKNSTATFTFSTRGKEITITYYNNSQEQVDSFQLRPTNKGRAVEIRSTDYFLALQSI